jgi:hypothetical protein
MDLVAANTNDSVHYIDLYDCYPINSTTLPDGTHASSNGSRYMGQEILRQLGWLNHLATRTYAMQPLGAYANAPAYQFITNTTTLYEITSLSTIVLAPGVYVISGKFNFSGGSGTGSKVSIDLAGQASYVGNIAALTSVNGYHWLAYAEGLTALSVNTLAPQNGSPQPSLPVAATVPNTVNIAWTISLEYLVLNVIQGGRIVVSMARTTAPGGDPGCYLRESSFIEAKRLR